MLDLFIETFLETIKSSFAAFRHLRSGVQACSYNRRREDDLGQMGASLPLFTDAFQYFEESFSADPVHESYLARAPLSSPLSAMRSA